ncbi:scoloptoxin SSD14-like [Coccinella septempunctata]|uniref:scoloptoxin SSD14-like n=1 Tax=Coccinella septempunctata TaxID=41139 RepID=UPI001D081C73|nr:scoloptoxin SSD14-like [Coccinella septempunctata]
METDYNSQGEISREDLPLKSNKPTSTCEEYIGGSKFINISFGTLTVIITIALLLQIYYGDYQVVPHGSVATDNLECSEIGTAVLKKGGNAVDAAIASTFCLSVFAPHITGLDADGQLLMYNHRLRAPAVLVDFSNLNVSTDLPRLVLGLAYCHKKYGSLSWKDLIEPSIKYARDGFLVSKVLVQAVQLRKAVELFGHLEASQLIRVKKLPETMQSIAEVPENQLYSYIKPDNTPIETEAYKFTFNNYNIFVPNVPSIGPELAVVMKQIEKFKFTLEDTKKTRFFYKMAEIMQIVYRDFNIGLKFHEGVSANVVAVDKDDNYVSLITGLTFLFGSGEMTSSGYIMNAKLENRQCSRLPILITDANHVCGRRIIFGANNIAMAAQVISSLLLADMNVTESIESPRFHLSPIGTIGLERFHYPSFDKEIAQYLQSLSSVPYPVYEPYESVNIVEKTGDLLSSHSDSRGGGIASRF